MKRNAVLALCVAFAFTLVCSSTAVAQSTPPTTTKPPVALSPMALLQQSITSKEMEATTILRGLADVTERQTVIASDLAKSRAVEDKSGVSIESFPEIVKNLQAKRIELIIELAGLKARREAIVAARADKPDNSAILTPLRKIIALQEKELNRISKSNGSAAEIRAAEIALLSSKIQLANANAAKPGSTLLRDTLLNTSLAYAEAKARLAKTESLLDEILPTRKQLDSVTRLKAKAKRLLEVETDLTRQLLTANRAVDQLRAQLEQMKEDNAQ